MVPAACATSSIGRPSPHSVDRAADAARRASAVRSTVSMSIETRPTSVVRTPSTSTGVPFGAWRG